MGILGKSSVESGLRWDEPGLSSFAFLQGSMDLCLVFLNIHLHPNSSRAVSKKAVVKRYAY